LTKKPQHRETEFFNRIGQQQSAGVAAQNIRKAVIAIDYALDCRLRT
jgi:hypothetical protein